MAFFLSSFLRALFGLFQPTNPQPPPQDATGDVVILVIGPTGVGKSTFVNRLVGCEAAQVGHGLSTCTLDFATYRFELPQDFAVYPGKPVVLVDTPGFDETTMHDSTRVFKGIAQWISEYPKKQDRPPQIIGFIYLHDISQKRINKRQNVDLLRLEELLEIGSAGTYSKLVLVTYRWPPPPPAPPPDPELDSYVDLKPGPGSLIYHQAVDRELELKDKFWKSLLDKGARMARVEDPVRDPMEVVSEVLK